MLKITHINFKGDLFATSFCFATQAAVRLGSSLILTRVLPPEAYGVITIILSVAFVVELIADMNVAIFVIRNENAEDAHFLNTAWTLQFGRAALNTTILFLLAPLISASIYHVPELTTPLRVYSLSFVLSGFQSMSFPLAIRHKKARFNMYSELFSTLVSATFSIVYCYYYRNFWGMIYGMLLYRLLMTFISYRFYPAFRPKPHFDWRTAREILGYTKFTMPSSLLTLALSQFDKIVLLRLFDLRLLGVYSLAGNISGAVEALVTKISNTVLYPRCAETFRNRRDNLALEYYTENAKLFFSIMILPAAVGGGAQLIIAMLYPRNYTQAGLVLQAFMIRAVLLSLAAPAEELLIATGEYRVILIGNVYRSIAIVSATLTGYSLLGFMGFVYGMALSGLPPLIYYWSLQRAKGLMIIKYEAYKVGFAVCIALLAYLVSKTVLTFWVSGKG